MAAIAERAFIWASCDTPVVAGEYAAGYSEPQYVPCAVMCPYCEVPMRRLIGDAVRFAEAADAPSKAVRASWLPDGFVLLKCFACQSKWSTAKERV